MVTIRYEIYKDENNWDKDLIKTFDTLEDFGKWLTDFATPYEDTDPHKHLALYVHDEDWLQKECGDLKAYMNYWPAYHLSAINYATDIYLWVDLVTNDIGVIYSGGKYTHWQKHISKEFAEFCRNLQYKYETSTVNFVD